MKDVRYSVLLALTNISDEAILEAELAPVGTAVVPPSGTNSENGIPQCRGDTRRGKGAGLLLPFAGWIAAAIGIVIALGVMVALVRGGLLVNPFGPSPDTETSTEETTDEPAEDIHFEVWDGTVAKGFAGGTGTASDPYIINHPSQLAYLAQALSNDDSKAATLSTKSYRLEANLDLNHHEWKPIGTWDTPFSGHFDGNGYTVKNLTVTRVIKSLGYYVAGLFGTVQSGTVCNLILTDVSANMSNIPGSYEKVFVGGLAGRVVAAKGKEVTITDCKLERVRVKVKCSGAADVYQGGVAGRIVVAENGGFTGERLQATEVSLGGSDGEDYFQGILTGYTECRARFELRDVCLEGALGTGYNSGQHYFAAVTGCFSNKGGRSICKNVFAVCNNPLGSGYIFTYQIAVDKEAYQTFSFENCFMGHTNGSGSNPNGRNELMYYAVEERVTYRNCLYTISLPQNHRFSESVWDVSDPRHPRLR